MKYLVTFLISPHFSLTQNVIFQRLFRWNDKQCEKLMFFFFFQFDRRLLFLRLRFCRRELLF